MPPSMPPQQPPSAYPDMQPQNTPYNPGMDSSPVAGQPVYNAGGMP